MDRENEVEVLPLDPVEPARPRNEETQRLRVSSLIERRRMLARHLAACAEHERKLAELERADAGL